MFMSFLYGTRLKQVEDAAKENKIDLNQMSEEEYESEDYDDEDHSCSEESE